MNGGKPQSTSLDEIFYRFLIPCFSDLAVLAAIRLFFHRNRILFAVLLLIFLLSFAVRARPLKAAAALWGGILGIYGEWRFVQAGMWVYAHPSFGGLPCWLVFVWPVLMMSFLEMAEYLDEKGLTGFPRARLAVTVLLAAMALFFTVTGLALAGGPISLGLFIFLAFALIFAHKPFHILLFVIAAVVGFTGEFICVKWGVWYYTHPGLPSIGMPVSLPLAWGLSALLVWLAATASAMPFEKRRKK